MIKRVLITGSRGFTGQVLTHALANDGLEVHGLARPSDASPDGGEALHTADLRRPAELRAVLAEVRPDAIIHLAGIAHVAHDNVEDMYLDNVVGTRNLLDESSRAAHPLQQIILASSANVYGNQRSAALTEDQPFLPVSDYGVSKAAAEMVAGTYAERLPITIVRPFNYTGVGQSQSFLLPKIVAHFRRRADRIELGNTEVARDFSDVRDVAQIYRRLLGNGSAIGKTVNICSGRATSLREIIALCRELTGHDLQIVTNPAFVRANEVQVLAGSTARLDALIGPIPRTPLIDTLRWMLSESRDAS